MSFLNRRLYLIILLTAVIIVSFYVSGIISPSSLGLSITEVNLADSSILTGQNTTLTVIIENRATRPNKFQFNIVYTGKNLTYHDAVNNIPLPEPEYNGENYTTTYPISGTLGPNENTELIIKVEGGVPIGHSQQYTVFLEVYGVNDYPKVLHDKRSVSLTVVRQT